MLTVCQKDYGDFGYIHTAPFSELMKNGMQRKVIAITGASSGIGKATAELLAAPGAKVIWARAEQTGC